MSFRWLSIFVLLFSALHANATAFTVGPGADYAAIGPAINAALQTAGQHEIRIAQGEFTASSNITLPTGFSLRISGGWNSGFTSQVSNPGLSIWRADPSQPVITCVISGDGVLELANLRITGGDVSNDNAPAGGISASLSQEGQLRLSGLSIDQNLGRSTAGLFVQATDASHLDVSGVSLRANRSTATSTQVSGIGGRLSLSANASAAISNTDISANQDAAGASTTFGAGLDVTALQSAQLSMNNIRIVDHTLNASTSGGSGLYLSAGGNSVISLARLQLQNNRALSATQGFRDQASMVVSENATFALSDSLITNGSGRGMTLSANTTGLSKIVNATIAANASAGLVFESNFGSGNHLLMNSILHGNGFGSNLSVAVTRLNTIGGDLGAANPQFVSATDFRLQAQSAAINAGVNSTALATVSALDLVGNPRIAAGVVDIGAYEFQNDVFFSNGFEGGL